MKFRPVLAKIGALVGIVRPGMGAGIQILAGQPIAPGAPIAQAVKDMAAASGAASTTLTLDAIAKNDNATLTAIKPIRRSVEGWAAIIGGSIMGINSLGPLLGITPDPAIIQAAESVFMGFGAKPGVGTAFVYLAMGGFFGFLWIRKKWFTHSITPAAADRAIAQGKAV